MKRVTRLIASVGATAAVMAAMAGSASAALPTVVYSSAPVAGTTHSPSVGPEAYSFNRVGGEVLTTRRAKIRLVKVTLTDWALSDSATTFQVPITLHLNRAAQTLGSGEIVPGSHIMNISKTFNVRYQPVGGCSDPTAFRDQNGVCKHGINQTIKFTVARKLPRDVVWSVSFNTDNSGPKPLGGSDSPTDSLNVAFNDAISVGSQPHAGAFWDTRFAGFNGDYAPFVQSAFNFAGDISVNTAPGFKYPAVSFVAWN